MQVFDQDGKLPDALVVRANRSPPVVWADPEDRAYVAEHNGGYFSILDADGNRLERWGGPEFRSCHGAAGDSDGSIYFRAAGRGTVRAPHRKVRAEIARRTWRTNSRYSTLLTASI